MKKFELLAIVLFFAFTANAQWQFIPRSQYNNSNYECTNATYNGCIASGSVFYVTMTAACSNPGMMGQFVDLEIERTYNGGQNWIGAGGWNLGYTGEVFEINYVTPDFGYLRTIEEYSYRFYRFQSEMNNVQECNFNSSEMILSATMFSYDEIIAVTETGAILHLEGNNMVQISQLPFQLKDAYVNPIFTYTSNYSLFLGCKAYIDNNYKNDLILKSEDQGFTWDTIFISSTQSISDIKFSNDSLGFAIGDFGLIMKTTDAGENWSTINSNTTYPLFSIDFMNDQQWICSGVDGIVMYSEDEGESWTQLYTPTIIPIRKILFPDKDQMVMALTVGYNFYKTTLDVLTGIDQNNVISNIQISPNPAENFIEITLKNSETISHVQILNMAGKSLIDQKAASSQVRADLSMLPDGIYIVKVITKNNQFAGKLVVDR